MNKRYCIDIKEVPYENKKKKEEPKPLFPWTTLILAVIVALILSPDLVRFNTYTLPKDKYEDTNSL